MGHVIPALMVKASFMAGKTKQIILPIANCHVMKVSKRFGKFL